MPNRIIKESICISDSIDELTWFEEVFYYRLIVNVDDFGRCDARTPVLKARLFPLKNLTAKQIDDCINKLSSAGMVLRYEINSKPFLQIVAWEQHQQIRSKKSKFPAPTKEQMEKHANLQTFDINCNQVLSNVTVIQSNPIQSESQSESLLHGVANATSEPQPHTIFELILNDNTYYPVSQWQIDKWQTLYPGVNVEQELRNMIGWLEANQKKRKTKAGIQRFINAWLSKEQDKGGNANVGYTNPQQFKPSRI